MVKKRRIGQSAAKSLGDKRKVQRLEKVISLRRNLHECQNKALVPFGFPVWGFKRGLAPL
jgi:hypothetical protein